MVEIFSYFGERIVILKIGILIALLLALVHFAAPLSSIKDLVAVLAFLILSVIALRIWDDLESLIEDRLSHPNRVLPRSSSSRKFNWLTLLLLGASVLAAYVIGGAAAVLILGALNVTLLLIYRALAPSSLQSALVLGKYPVLVMVASWPDVLSDHAGRTVAAMAVAWISTAADELRSWLRN